MEVIWWWMAHVQVNIPLQDREAHTFYLLPLAERPQSHSSEKMEMKGLERRQKQGLTRTGERDMKTNVMWRQLQRKKEGIIEKTIKAMYNINLYCNIIVQIHLN